MKWFGTRPPKDNTAKHMVEVWTDKHGHVYFYDPIEDVFWHRHITEERITWWKSREGLGR